MIYDKYSKMQDECQNVWIMLHEHLNMVHMWGTEV
jgi:hypothetical protein